MLGPSAEVGVCFSSCASRKFYFNAWFEGLTNINANQSIFVSESARGTVDFKNFAVLCKNRLHEAGVFDFLCNIMFAAFVCH
jgi:hypothetical protein